MTFALVAMAHVSATILVIRRIERLSSLTLCEKERERDGESGSVSQGVMHGRGGEARCHHRALRDMDEFTSYGHIVFLVFSFFLLVDFDGKRTDVTDGDFSDFFRFLS